MAHSKQKAIVIIDVTSEDCNKPLDAFPFGKRIFDALETVNLDLLCHLTLTEVGWKRGIHRNHILTCLQQIKQSDNKPIVYIQDIQRMRNSKYDYLLEILEGITIVRSIDDLLCEASRE